MLAILTRVIIFFALLTTISILIPQPLIAQIDSSISYFASQICSLNLFVNAQTLLNAISFFIGSAATIIVFVLCFYFVRVTGGTDK